MEKISTEFINLIRPINSLEDLNRPTQTEGGDTTFFNVFQNAWSDVKDTRLNYLNEQYLLATGQTDDPHNVMIASSKAELSVEFLVQLRSKALEAYDQLIKTSF